MRQDDGVNAVVNFAESYWWLIFIVPPVLGGALQRRHARRLAIIAAKGELEEKRQAALQLPPDPQPICGCSHHLSFPSPNRRLRGRGLPLPAVRGPRATRPRLRPAADRSRRNRLAVRNLRMSRIDHRVRAVVNPVRLLGVLRTRDPEK